MRWHHSPRAVAYALDVLTRLAKRYRDRAALFGIEVLNEPIDWPDAMSSSSRQAKDSFEARRVGPIPMVFLKRFYRESYRRLRPIFDENQALSCSMTASDWAVGGTGLCGRGMRGVMLDTHIYLVMAEHFPLFRMIPERWMMSCYRLFVRGMNAVSASSALYASDQWGSGVGPTIWQIG